MHPLDHEEYLPLSSVHALHLPWIILISPLHCCSEHDMGCFINQQYSKCLKALHKYAPRALRNPAANIIRHNINYKNVIKLQSRAKR